MQKSRQAYPPAPKVSDNRRVNSKRDAAKSGYKSSSASESQRTDSTSSSKYVGGEFAKYSKYMVQIIKLQAMYRGYLERKNAPLKVRALLGRLRSAQPKVVAGKGKKGERQYEDGSKYVGTFLPS